MEKGKVENRYANNRCSAAVRKVPAALQYGVGEIIGSRGRAGDK